ncbi:MAG TPA: aldo/keto reductase [Gemmatimonadales bacterium]|nr:aldo/keto reductase [Gemmatimonadales bacterium]
MMQQRVLGPGAPSVSAVGYGGMHLSIEGRPPESRAVEVMRAALTAGVTLVDTADVYCLDQHDIGHNERLIARALSGWKGDRSAIVVATKGGVVRPDGRWESDARPAQLRAAAERSLRALDVPRLDLYQLHAPDPRVPFADSVGALARLRDEGKIRWVGLSNVSVAQVRAAQGIVPITTVQNRLNPFFRESLTGSVVRYCAEQGIGFLAYSPTGGGRLNRTLPSHPVLAEIAARHGATAHAVVLAWALAQSPMVIVIPSARSVEHALDSVGAAGLELSPRDLAAIDAAEFSRA